MVRDLRSRPPTAKNEISNIGGGSSRKGAVAKTESTPVKAKRAKVESVIRITRSREPRVLEPVGTGPPSPSNKDEVAVPREEVNNQRIINATYKDHVLIITGVSKERLIEDNTIPIERPTKHKLEDAQDPPKKRRKVDWAARNARSPRRSLRNAHMDSTPDRGEMDNQEAGSQSTNSELPHEEQMTKFSEHGKPQVEECISRTAKQDRLGSTVPTLGLDSFKSPETDVTENFFDALAEQSAGRSPDQSRKVASEPSIDQSFEPAIESPAEQSSKSLIEEIEQAIIDDEPNDVFAPAHMPDSQNSSPSNRQTASDSEGRPVADIIPSSPFVDLLTEAALEAASNPEVSPTTPTSADSPSIVPYLPIPDPPPPRSTFADNEAYTLATKFPPLLPLPNFITALTSQALVERSTSDLYDLALSTQKALQAWQDEYIKLDKKTAPVAGPFPKKPATGGRQPIDKSKWEDEKEKELFGEGTLLADIVKRRARAKRRPKTAPPPPPIIHEGRELRKRKTDASFIEGLGISEDDAGALTESKRPRKPVRRFEVGQNGEARRGIRRGRGGLNGGTGPAHADAIGRNGYESDAIHQSVDSEAPASQPRLQKRGRLSALQQSYNNDSNETSPSPTPDPADGDFSDANAPTRRRAQPPTASKTPTAGTEPRKQRKKSEKRSESMTAWWAERKKKEKAAKAAAVAAVATGVGGKGSALGSGVAVNKVAGMDGKEKRGSRRDVVGGDERTEKVFGPAGLDARGGLMENWSQEGWPVMARSRGKAQ